MRTLCVSVEAAISHSIFGNSESASQEGLLLLADRRSRSECAPNRDPWRSNLNLENSTPRDKSRASFALPKPPSAPDFQRMRHCVRRKTLDFCREKSSSLPAHKMDHLATKGVSEQRSAQAQNRSRNSSSVALFCPRARRTEVQKWRGQTVAQQP